MILFYRALIFVTAVCIRRSCCYCYYCRYSCRRCHRPIRPPHRRLIGIFPLFAHCRPLANAVFHSMFQWYPFLSEDL